MPNTIESTTAQTIIDTSERNWEANKHNCSGFVKAVAGEFNVTLTGTANQMVDYLSDSSHGWEQLGTDSIKAQNYANNGYLIIAGLKGTAHGHVVVIVATADKTSHFPIGYWGQLGGIGRKNSSINNSWRASVRQNVKYFAKPVN